MFIASKISNNLGVSLIKNNNKISACIAKKNEQGKAEIIFKCDKEFPFNNPLITSNAVKIFEFIIEVNNLFRRLDERGELDNL